MSQTDTHTNSVEHHAVEEETHLIGGEMVAHEELVSHGGEHTEEYAEGHSSIHISLAPEVIGKVGSFEVTNSLLTSLIISVLFLAVIAKVQRTKFNLKSGFYNFIEMLVEGLSSLVESVMGRGKVVPIVVAVIGTYFFYILLNNWLGIMPLIGSVSINHAGHDVHLLRSTFSDLNMTLAFATISVILIQVFGFGVAGLKGYGSKFVSKNPIMMFVGILEIISEFVKIVSFAFRLFGNIFAGEVLLAVMYFLMPYGVPIPFLGIELFAGFIQALIFSALSLVFIKGAVEHHAH